MPWGASVAGSTSSALDASGSGDPASPASTRLVSAAAATPGRSERVVDRPSMAADVLGEAALVVGAIAGAAGTAPVLEQPLEPAQATRTKIDAVDAYDGRMRQR